jgi:hypothetical protein
MSNAGPLGLDFWLGLPESEAPRVAPTIPADPPGPGDPGLGINKRGQSHVDAAYAVLGYRRADDGGFRYA